MPPPPGSIFHLFIIINVFPEGLALKRKESEMGKCDICMRQRELLIPSCVSLYSKPMSTDMQDEADEAKIELVRTTPTTTKGIIFGNTP
jgi:hypothetical protein